MSRSIRSQSALKAGTAIEAAEAYWFCTQSIQWIWYHFRMSTGSLRLWQASLSIACLILSSCATILSTKSPAAEVVPWATPKIVAATTRRCVIIPRAAASVDRMVVPLGTVKVLVSESDGAAPPVNMTEYLAAWATSVFRTAMMCCLSVNGCTPAARSYWYYMRSWRPRRRFRSAGVTTMANQAASEAVAPSRASCRISRGCAFSVLANNVQSEGRLATFSRLQGRGDGVC